MLFRHALWMTGRQDVAADVVQETYYQAWRSINNLKDDSKALPWLLTILRRCIYQEQRCQYRQAETVEQLQHLDSHHTQDEYRLLEIYRALESISSKHRDIFLLHYLHGFSYEEISEQLNIPKGTVMSRLSRARNALQAVVEYPAINNIVQLRTVREE